MIYSEAKIAQLSAQGARNDSVDNFLTRRVCQSRYGEISHTAYISVLDVYKCVCVCVIDTACPVDGACGVIGYSLLKLVSS